MGRKVGPISTLDLECLVNILIHLPLRDLVRASGTCTRWKDMINSEWFLGYYSLLWMGKKTCDMFTLRECMHGKTLGNAYEEITSRKNSDRSRIHMLSSRLMNYAPDEVTGRHLNSITLYVATHLFIMPESFVVVLNADCDNESILSAIIHNDLLANFDCYISSFGEFSRDIVCAKSRSVLRIVDCNDAFHFWGEKAGLDCNTYDEVLGLDKATTVCFVYTDHQSNTSGLHELHAMLHALKKVGKTRVLGFVSSDVKERSVNSNQLMGMYTRMSDSNVAYMSCNFHQLEDHILEDLGLLADIDIPLHTVNEKGEAEADNIGIKSISDRIFSLLYRVTSYIPHGCLSQRKTN